MLRRSLLDAIFEIINNEIIRTATAADREGIWSIFERVIQSGDTYVIPPSTSQLDMDKYWLSPAIDTFVLNSNSQVLGTYTIKPNQIGAGSHIANGSYMVHPDHRGMGIGKRLCEHSISYARAKG